MNTSYFSPRRVIGLLVAVMMGMSFPGGVFAQVTGVVTTFNPVADILTKITAAFPANPEMLAVAKCESGYRQFAVDGSVLRDKTTGRYVGIFQIDEPLHSARAMSLGHDILTIDGNIGFAKVLFAERGIMPWKGCAPAGTVTVTDNTTNSVTPIVSGTITSNLSGGMRNPQVKILQQKLNAFGFMVAPSGAGSPGQETEFFGAMTREAVRKFQCAKGIVCEGDEWTTGYGRVGPKTRAAFNAKQ